MDTHVHLGTPVSNTPGIEPSLVGDDSMLFGGTAVE
jgi:hypothetical protein